MTEDPKKDPGVRVVDRRWWAQEDAGDAAADVPGRKPTYVEELERRLAERAEELQTYATEHRRSLDEFEQVKVRMRRDVAREVERGRRAVLAAMLDVIDNLDRAVVAAQDGRAESEAVDQLARGVELVRDQFLSTLAGFGVARVRTIGEPFDAVRHEAVTTMDVAAADEGKVMAVLKEGYAIGDDVLRPASVVVGRAESA